MRLAFYVYTLLIMRAIGRLSLGGILSIKNLLESGDGFEIGMVLPPCVCEGVRLLSVASLPRRVVVPTGWW